jgi:threonine synthase
VWDDDDDVRPGIAAVPASTGAPAHENPFVRFDRSCGWAAFAAAHGMTRAQRSALVERFDDGVFSVGGVGFRETPFGRSEHLSDALGFDAKGGVWVKDETRGVGGSQKARHLASIMLHLLAAESLGLLSSRPRLAISSCGNAAIAAATLARAAAWPIDVYVPTWMADGFGVELDRLGATIHRCARLADDSPGDPAMLRFREAVEAGAIPLSVQGPENALCLDGGRTIGWEIASRASSSLTTGLDRVFVQVGGGAFATSLSDGLDAATRRAVPLFAVQAAGCAPLARAWNRADGATEIAARWREVMTVWEEPRSLADGILDDETYDWLGVFEAMGRNGGRPVVVAERSIERAHEFAQAAGFDVSPTGSAGLAGLVEMCEESSGEIHGSENVAVVMSGVSR